MIDTIPARCHSYSMIRTQIQLPEPLYAQIKALAALHEWSLAEAMRRGAELLLRSYPERPSDIDSWSLPDGMPLGVFGAPVDQWRDIARERDS